MNPHLQVAFQLGQLQAQQDFNKEAQTKYGGLWERLFGEGVTELEALKRLATQGEELGPQILQHRLKRIATRPNAEHMGSTYRLSRLYNMAPREAQSLQLSQPVESMQDVLREDVRRAFRFGGESPLGPTKISPSGYLYSEPKPGME